MNETLALEGGMWVPTCPCLVYHHRTGGGGAGENERVALAPASIARGG